MKGEVSFFGVFDFSTFTSIALLFFYMYHHFSMTHILRHCGLCLQQFSMTTENRTWVSWGVLLSHGNIEDLYQYYQGLKVAYRISDTSGEPHKWYVIGSRIYITRHFGLPCVLFAVLVRMRVRVWNIFFVDDSLMSLEFYSSRMSDCNFLIYFPLEFRSLSVLFWQFL